MNGQQLLDGLLEALDRQDNETVERCFAGLYGWLSEGKKPPVAENLGTFTFAEEGKRCTRARSMVVSGEHPFTIDADPPYQRIRYVFRVWSDRGEILEEFELGQAVQRR